MIHYEEKMRHFFVEFSPSKDYLSYEATSESGASINGIIVKTHPAYNGILEMKGEFDAGENVFMSYGCETLKENEKL